jgi:dephospho-CoA kinase
MGKSTAAAALRRYGVPVFDADAAVHVILGRGGAGVSPVGAAFPGVVEEGAVVRSRLGKIVFEDRAALARLEAIVHPLVRQAERRFLARAARRRQPVVAFDIPLLFETQGQRRYDLSAVVSAPGFVQAARVLARPGMTAERLASIRARQTPDSEKRRRADAVIPTGIGRRVSLAHIARLVRRLQSPAGRAWLAAKRRRGRHA